jgi:hypothetical protein
MAKHTQYCVHLSQSNNDTFIPGIEIDDNTEELGISARSLISYHIHHPEIQAFKRFLICDLSLHSLRAWKNPRETKTENLSRRI